MRFRLVPQTGAFYKLYAQASGNCIAIGEELLGFLHTFPAETTERLARIESLEHAGDRLTREFVDLLNRTFVTPFDRDDMLRLIAVIDDICDHVHEAADHIEVYGVKQIPESAIRQAEIIRDAAVQLDAAVGRLDGFRDARPQLQEMRRLEDEGDRVEREAVAGLFRSGQDAVSILRWKDIYQRLEEAVDSFQTASDVLEAILIKNA